MSVQATTILRGVGRMSSTPTVTTSLPSAGLPAAKDLTARDMAARDMMDATAFRRQMDEVVARIPMHAIRSVLDAVEGAPSPNGERARHSNPSWSTIRSSTARRSRCRR